MLYHADNPEHKKYNVFHVPACRRLKNVYWADTETAQYAVWNASYTHQADVTVKQAKKIVAYDDKKLILIDPIEDDGNDTVTEHKELVA